MRFALTALATLVLVSSARPLQAPGIPDTPRRAADRVLAAVSAEDEGALRALAERNEPDPWRVAHELCYLRWGRFGGARGNGLSRMPLERVVEVGVDPAM
jgi:hypothetical protein